MAVKFIFEQAEHNLWVLFLQTCNVVSSCEEKTFSEYGLNRAQFGIMMAAKHLGPLATLAEIARWLDRKPNTISIVVDHMVKSGLVKRRRNLRDRRSVCIELTNKGQTTYNKVIEPAWKNMKVYLSGLDSKQVKTLTEILERIRENAYQYINPQIVFQEIGVDKERFSDFLSKIGDIKKQP